MITKTGYSKDQSIPPEGIVITFGKEMIKRNGGYKEFIKYFLVAINNEDDYWMHKMTNRPTKEFEEVYIIIMNRLWGKVKFGWYESHKTFAYSENDKKEIAWPRMVEWVSGIQVLYKIILMTKTLAEFNSSHNLDFYSARWNNPFNTEDWQVFKIGTCSGQWVATKDTYDILSIINDSSGNGHFDDVLQWFENSCKRDGKNLRILEVWNKRLALNLVTKRGFTYHQGDNLIKRFV